MVGVQNDLGRLLTAPQDSLEALLARRALGLSMALGAASYYWSTLQVSELLFAPPLGPVAYFVLNGLVALGWMALLPFLIHLASRLLGETRGRWLDLFLLWGYTQLPAIVRTALFTGLLAILPPAGRAELGTTWIALGVAVVLLLTVWGIILKVNAIRVCYDLGGRRLFKVIVLALLLYGLVAGLEFGFVAERGLVPEQALNAMAPAGGPIAVWREQVSLPFDRLTYHLRPPRRGETVGFVPPGGEGFASAIFRSRVRFLGRVVGVPGEVVELRGGAVYIDDTLYDEPYRVGGRGRDIPPTRVPPGHVFVIGDNRDVPLTDYHGGLVADARIRGRLTETGRMKWAFLVGKGRW